MDHHGGRAEWFGFKTIVGGALALFGLGLTLYGMGIGLKPLQKPLAGAADQPDHRPVRAMNLALGPMVFIARELDFTVKNTKGETLDDNRIAARLEIQLQSLRELYRQESAANAKLLGSLTLQFNLSPAGEVSQVKVLSGRIADGEFKKAVVSAAAKWHLPDLINEPIVAQVALLFVQEGMDITTLVRWERGLAGAPERVAVLGDTPSAKAEAHSPAPTLAAKPAPVAETTPVPPVKTESDLVQIKYPTLLRKEPNFSSPVLATFTIGTKLHVMPRGHEWLQVRSQHSGPSGFIRKEFVAPAQMVVNR